MLNGGKTFTTNAHYADVCVAMAVTDRAASQHGISAFILEKGTPGFRVGKKENKLGMRASATGEVLFTDCRLPEIAAARQARRRIRRQPSHSGWRPHLHRGALGRHRAGRLRSRAQVFEAAQTIRAVYLRVSGDPGQARRHGHGDRGRAPAYSIAAGARRTRDSASPRNPPWPSCLRPRSRCARPMQRCRFTAAYGFIKDYPVEKFYRDVKLCTIGEGTSEIQRLVIARQLLKE